MSSLTNNNEYLKLREEKILRNQQKLEKLGLAGAFQQHTPVRSLSPVSSSFRKRQKHEGKKGNDKDEANPFSRSSPSAPINVRRSSRVKNIVSYKDPDSIWYAEQELGIELRRPRQTKRDYSHIHITNNHNTKQENTIMASFSSATKREEGRSSGVNTSTIKPGTTRSVSVSIQSILYGGNHDGNSKISHHDSHPTYIGRYLSAPNKAAVIEHANLHSGNPPGISFNKYSGVCEFRNDVMFLWVNIGYQGDVMNEFVEGGRKMTWYGGSRMTHDSPVIQRLIHIGQKANMDPNAKNDSSTPRTTSHSPISESGILLWCRIYDRAFKTFSPYICMGRLGYVSHDPDSNPIQFIWKLLDYNVLMTEEEGHVFQKVLNVSGL